MLTAPMESIFSRISAYSCSRSSSSSDGSVSKYFRQTDSMVSLSSLQQELVRCLRSESTWVFSISRALWRSFQASRAARDSSHLFSASCSRGAAPQAWLTASAIAWLSWSRSPDQFVAAFPRGHDRVARLILLLCRLLDLLCGAPASLFKVGGLLLSACQFASHGRAAFLEHGQPGLDLGELAAAVFDFSGEASVRAALLRNLLLECILGCGDLRQLHFRLPARLVQVRHAPASKRSISARATRSALLGMR